MTDVREIIDKAPWTGGPGPKRREGLNVTEIIGRTFALYWRGFLFFWPVAFVFSVFFELAVAEISVRALAVSPMETDMGILLTSTAFSFFGSFFHSSFTQALLVLAAVNLHQTGSLKLGKMALAVLGLLPAAFVVSLLVAVATIIGIAALILPGILIALALYVVMPTLMVERNGLRSISRSLRLTRDYRVALLGLAIIITLIALLLNSVVSIAMIPIMPEFGEAYFVDLVLDRLATSAIYAATYSLFTPIAAISATLAYLRLVEIKEGGDGKRLAEVFE